MPLVVTYQTGMIEAPHIKLGIPVAHFGQRSFQRKIKGIGTQFSQGMNPLLNALSSAPIFPDNKALATVFQGDAVDPGSGKLVLKATYKIESVKIGRASCRERV